MKQIAAQNRAVSAMFDEFSKGVTPLLARYKKPPIVTDVWLMNKEIESAINSELRTLQRRMSEFMKSEAAAAWNLSADKSDAMVNGYIKDLAVSDIAKEGLFNRNLEALKEFQSRTVNGLGLSDRVWKVCEQSKEQLELYMQSGLATGRSAANIAGDVKKYLKNPDARFRRVRDESGKLVLSKPMKDYHPGQGVYRSAYKNALRMTRTETNAAYRSADMERWKKIDFVKGYEVKLSNNHPAVDICDYLKGEYPKTFFFDGWHPNCYCYCVPVLPSQDDFVTYLNNDKLPGSPIKGIPPSAVKYIKDRSASFAGMKNKPFWLKNNFVSRNGVYYPKAGVDKPPVVTGVIKENPLPLPVVSKPVEFVPAKSIKEAEQWALNNLNVKYADFKGLDLEVANDINKSVFNIKAVMPEVKTYGVGNAQRANKALKAEIIEALKKSDWYKQIVKNFSQQAADRQAVMFANNQVSKVGGNTLAWSSNIETVRIPGGTYMDASKYKGVFVNEKYGKSAASINKIVADNERVGWYTKGAKDFGYIMSHELGHEIDKTIGFRSSEVFKAIYNREHAKGIQSVITNISKYGATAGGRSSHMPFEFIAESWAEFITSPTPRAIAKEIGEAMLKGYHDYYLIGTGYKFTEWRAEILKILSK